MQDRRATARVAPTEGLREVRCREESPSHGFAVPAPFRQGGQRDGERIATASVRTGFAMTGSFTWGAVDARAGRPGGRPLRKCILRCVGEGLCPSRGRGRTPPLRKRYKRCNGRATARVAPTERLQEVRCGEESPSHGFAVPAPFRQGGRGDGERIATASVRTGFAMTHCKECVGRADVGSELSAASGRGSEVSEWPRSKF